MSWTAKPSKTDPKKTTEAPAPAGAFLSTEIKESADEEREKN
jgi:hypothetical protein